MRVGFLVVVMVHAAKDAGQNGFGIQGSGKQLDSLKGEGRLLLPHSFLIA